MSRFDEIYGSEEPEDDSEQEAEAEATEDEEFEALDLELMMIGWYRGMLKNGVLPEDGTQAVDLINQEYRKWVKSQIQGLRYGTAPSSEQLTAEELQQVRSMLSNPPSAFSDKETVVLKALAGRVLTNDPTAGVKPIVTKPIAPTQVAVTPVIIKPVTQGSASPKQLNKPAQKAQSKAQAKPPKKTKGNALKMKAKSVNIPMVGESITLVPEQRSRLPGFKPMPRSLAEWEEASLSASTAQTDKAFDRPVASDKNSSGTIPTGLR